MKRELRELDLQIVIRFEFLDTPGDEVAPGSDKVGKHFENERFGHKHLRSLNLKQVHWLNSMAPCRWKSTGWVEVYSLTWVSAAGQD